MPSIIDWKDKQDILDYGKVTNHTQIGEFQKEFIMRDLNTTMAPLFEDRILEDAKHVTTKQLEVGSHAY